MKFQSSKGLTTIKAGESCRWRSLCLGAKLLWSLWTDSVLTKVFSVGKVTSKEEGKVHVHRHAGVADGALRVTFHPVFIENGNEVIGSGSQPAIEKIDAHH